MTPNAIEVSGTTTRGEGRPLLICEQRVLGETFLQGWLTLTGTSEQHAVRVHTFDERTVLEPLTPTALPPGNDWSGHLRLRPGARPPVLPADLAQALADAQLSTDQIDPSELTHLLHWLAEARGPHVRHQRIQQIITAARLP
ncbi:hypothetical protein [Saccharopolyspora griseoalba]|uniref:Uncharacterized protein n=1 Tax=Saccharopolyspora griseoalba TaxID=1431848 RepID=A0ABW2LRW4_9PSEU